MVCKKCSQKLFPKPTCGELKRDNPTTKHTNSSNEAQHTCWFDYNLCGNVTLLSCLRTLRFQTANFKKISAKQQRPTSPWWQCQPLYLVQGWCKQMVYNPSKGREVPCWNETWPNFGCSMWVGCMLTTPNQFIRSFYFKHFSKFRKYLGKVQTPLTRYDWKTRGKGYNSTHGLTFHHIYSLRSAGKRIQIKSGTSVASIALITPMFETTTRDGSAFFAEKTHFGQNNKAQCSLKFFFLFTTFNWRIFFEENMLSWSIFWWCPTKIFQKIWSSLRDQKVQYFGFTPLTHRCWLVTTNDD